VCAVTYRERAMNESGITVGITVVIVVVVIVLMMMRKP
jgi:hypothetical protein